MSFPDDEGDGRHRVTVVGGEGLTLEVTLRVLTESGADVTSSDGTDAFPDASKADVAVLVDPDPAHWDVIDLRASPIVVVSGRPLEDGAVVDAVIRGADAVLDATSAPDKLLEAVDVVAAGGTLLGPGHTRALAEAVRRVTRSSNTKIELTPRELDILISIDRGESVKQTARALGIAIKTVENLQSRMFRKLGVRNRAQAVARVHSLGLLPHP